MRLFAEAITHFSLLLSASIIDKASAAYTAKLIFQFPSSQFTAIENVAIRPNGQLLLTTTTAPAVYTLDSSEINPTATLLHTFPGVTACLGITELANDQYAVAVGNVSTTNFTGVPGSFSLWNIDLAKSPAVFTKIAAVPNAKILNGLTHVSSNPAIVLAADSEQGIIYSINTVTGAIATAVQSSALSPTASFPIGVNGIHASGNVLYYTNSALGTYGMIPINSQGQSAGAATVLVQDQSGNRYDDFVLDSGNNALITSHPNVMYKVPAGGVQTTVFNSTVFAQPTSVIYGLDGKTVYLVSGGQLSGTTITSGQVFKLTP